MVVCPTKRPLLPPYAFSSMFKEYNELIFVALPLKPYVDKKPAISAPPAFGFFSRTSPERADFRKNAREDIFHLTKKESKYKIKKSIVIQIKLNIVILNYIINLYAYQKEVCG